MEFDIEISGDDRKAFLIVISDEEDESKELTAEDLKLTLTEGGVCRGVNENVLYQICKDKLFNRKYLVAEAIPPKAGKNAEIRMRITPKERPTYDKGIDKEKQVDHYGIREGFITFVEKGEILSTRIPATQGENGFTVTGDEIEGILGKDVSLDTIQGQNTKIDGNNLFAAVDGIFKKIGKKINIEQSITLENDLGIKTGSIILPLEADIELIVPGDIKSGFRVQCNKITVMGTVEDAVIKARFLEVKNGIVGTSDNPIIVDFITTGFIIGTRRIKSRLVEVNKEISGGSFIQADFVRSQIIQECSITAKYGVWTKYLYGKNNIQVGVDIKESQEHRKLSLHLKTVENYLREVESTNKRLFMKADSIREMAIRMPNNPSVKKEFTKLSEAIDKIKKLENIKKGLTEKLQEHIKKMYITGSPFILVELGFIKKMSAKDQPKPINDLTIKEFSFEKSKPLITGLFTLEGEEVGINSNYNILEINELMENYKKTRSKE